MKKIFICTLIVLGITFSPAYAVDWASILNFIGKTSEMQTTPTVTMSDLEKQMAEIDNSVQASFVNIVSAISGWKETRSVKSQLKSDEALSAIITEYTNTYLQNNRQNIINKVNKMSAKEKTKLVNELSSLTQSGQNYLNLAVNGAKTAATTFQAAQNINEITTTLVNANKVASELKSRATTVMTLVNQIKSIATAAGVNVQG